MASKETIQERKRQLALRLDSSRDGLTSSSRELRRRLSPTRAIAGYLRRHPVQIFGATTGVVAIATYLLRPRSREARKPRSLKRRLVSWILSLVKPAIRLWVLKHAKSYIQGTPAPPATDSLLGP